MITVVAQQPLQKGACCMEASENYFDISFSYPERDCWLVDWVEWLVWLIFRYRRQLFLHRLHLRTPRDQVPALFSLGHVLLAPGNLSLFVVRISQLKHDPKYSPPVPMCCNAGSNPSTSLDIQQLPKKTKGNQYFNRLQVILILCDATQRDRLDFNCHMKLK